MALAPARVALRREFARKNSIARQSARTAPSAIVVVCGAFDAIRFDAARVLKRILTRSRHEE